MWQLLICAALIGGNCANLQVVEQPSEAVCYAVMASILDQHRKDKTAPPVWMACRVTPAPPR